MTARTLIRRSLRFHWRSHLGVVLGAAIGSAALIGALIVGESVKETLHERAVARLGNADNALYSHDRFFTEELGLSFAKSSAGEASATLLKLPATIASADGTARANSVQVLGVRNYFQFTRPPGVNTNSSALRQWRGHTDVPIGGILLNAALAQRLNARVGDTVLVRVQKPSALSRDAVITPQSDHSVAMRLRVNGIADAAHGGDLDLQVSQLPALNAFVRLNELSEAAGISGKANMILAGSTRTREPATKLRQVWVKLQSFIPGSRARQADRVIEDSPEQQVARLNAQFKARWRIDDAELTVKAVNTSQAQLNTPRIFLDQETFRAATTIPPAPPVQAPAAAVGTVAPVPSNFVMVTRYQVRMAEVMGALPPKGELPAAATGKDVWLEPATSRIARAASRYPPAPRPRPIPPVVSGVTNA
ncbi:MAG TPA: ABC transporter permease, partial [Candidatus Acidoferrum sp.]|nr:ABC transporter permease [Candidatus Acidoferrum sp.]